METTASQNNQVAVIKNSIEILKSGGEILLSNQARKDKALAVGRNILTAIQNSGVTPEIDERAMNYLANVSAATKEMKESRNGVTQIMDQLKKMYTEVENELDVNKTGTIPSQIQAHRNAYAKEQAAIAEQKRLEAERKAAKEKEAIDLKYQFENQLTNYYTDHLLEKKRRLQEGFNGITLDTFDEKSEKIRNYTPVYDKAHFQKFSPTFSSSVVHSPSEMTELIASVLEGKYETLAANYVAELTLLKDELIEKLPSKKAELLEQKRLADEAAAEAERSRLAEEKRQKELAAAKESEKKRLEAEQAKQRAEEEQRQAELKKQQEEAAELQRKREAEEAERMRKEAEEAKLKAEQAAAIAKQGEETMVLFEKEAELATDKPAPEVRQGYEIEILHPVGYTQVFAFWFENEGKNLPVDKIGNTKLDQMKTWAEKKAHKDGTKIESKFLKYNETFKAVNRKAKAE